MTPDNTEAVGALANSTPPKSLPVSWSAPNRPAKKSATFNVASADTQAFWTHRHKQVREYIGEAEYQRRPCPMKIVGHDDDGDPDFWFEHQFGKAFVAQTSKESVKKYQQQLLQMALHLAPGGRLRPFVPYEPRWCRTLPELAVTMLTMREGHVLTQASSLIELYRVATQFQAVGRRTVDPLKD